MADGMFSVLPESILFLIIALLSFRDAARTTLLSRNWQNIWYSAKNIEFNEKKFVRSNDDEAEKEVQRRNFIGFVTRWIQRYNGGPIINKFSFVFKNPQEYVENINFLLTFLHQNKVKFLELDFSNPNWDGIDLQNQSASCGRITFEHGDNILEYLRLFACKVQFNIEFNQFYALKTLCLGWTEATTESVKNLLSKCPVLENLELEKCWSLNYLEIVVPTLKDLVINNCVTLSEGVKVDAPNLEFFKYIGLVVQTLELNSSPVNAYFDFGTEFRFQEEIRDVLVDLLIDQVFNIEILTICNYILQVVPLYEVDLEYKFESVYELTLRTRLHHEELYGVYFFLIMCPDLENLCIDLSCPEYILFEEAIFLDQETADEEVPLCLTHWLTTLEVKWFSGQPNEFLVLEYLLKHGAVLKTVSIEVAQVNDPNLELYRRVDQLLQFSRASNDVQFFII